ncbi:MAG: toprim domain-containing protein [Fibrobacterales bacterium]
MKKWTKDEIAHLKDLNPIEVIAAELGVAVVRGRARCIFPENHAHGDRTPSMSIGKGSYKCWVCDSVWGDVINFVMQVQGSSFAQALVWLASRTPGHFLDMSSESPIGVGIQGVVSSKPVALKRKVHFSLDLEYRSQMILSFLKLCKPVDGVVLKYLVSRKIFKKFADAQKVRMIENYDQVNKAFKELYPIEDLKEYGFYSETSHLRFYKHPLIFPYLNRKGRPVYFQARSIEAGIQPKELNIKGPISIPYNAQLLNEKPGIVFLCEGVIDALTMITKNFPTIGVPGVSSFKSEWFVLFKNKNVFIAFDADSAGKNAAERLHAQFSECGIASSIISLPEGEDINQWFST